MAEITNPEAVKFCNEKIRVAASRYAALYFKAKEIAAEWAANPDLATNMAYDNTDLVVDGSAKDGRHPISGVDVNNIINRLNELVSVLEADGHAKLNTVLGVASIETV